METIIRRSWLSSLLPAAAAVLTMLAGCNEDKPPDSDKDGFADAADCAARDPQAWQRLAFASRDEDGDGVRVNVGGQLCAGAALPANRFAAVTSDVDCDDANAARWTMRHHDALDADGDGFAVAGAGDVCSGAALPAGYVPALPAAADLDCDDAISTRWTMRHHDALDADGDGFAVAGAGDVCSGAALPAGYVQVLPAAADLDCDDSASSRWRLHSYLSRDLDGDGYRENKPGTFCGQGAMPANLSPEPYFAEYVDCDDADITRWRLMATFRDLDGDGAGGSTAVRQCMGYQVPNGYALAGYDPLDDPGNPSSASISTVELPAYLFVVIDDGDDDDIP
jgi:hypothetical protein